MTKIQLAIETTTWQIEDAEKNLEQYRQRIEDNVKKEFFNEHNSEFIASYAKHMEEEYKKLRFLREQLMMLKSLAKED